MRERRKSLFQFASHVGGISPASALLVWFRNDDLIIVSPMRSAANKVGFLKARVLFPRPGAVDGRAEKAIEMAGPLESHKMCPLLPRGLFEVQE